MGTHPDRCYAFDDLNRCHSLFGHISFLGKHALFKESVSSLCDDQCECLYAFLLLFQSISLFNTQKGPRYVVQGGLQML